MQPVVAIERLLGLVLALDEDTPISAPALAERLQVSLRTVYRDVRRLQDAGVPVVAEPGRRGGLRLAPGFRMTPLALSTPETLALTLAIEHLRALPTLPFRQALDTAARKIASAARVARPELLQQPHRWLRVEPAAQDAFHPERPLPADQQPATAGVVQTFVEALLAGRRLAIDYRSPYRAEAPGAQPYDPAGLIADRGLWYLVAFPSHGLATARHLRADRVLSCQLDAPMDLSRQPAWQSAQPRPWLHQAMQRWTAQSPVCLRISPTQAQRLASDWFFSTGQVEPAEDGMLDFRWGENEFERVRELLAWLGTPARLIEPVAWIEPMRAALRAHAEAQLGP